MSIPHGFDEAFERVKELTAIFNQNEHGYQSIIDTGETVPRLVTAYPYEE